MPHLAIALASTPHFGAPPLIYHPCQGRASAAAPGAPSSSRWPSRQQVAAEYPDCVFVAFLDDVTVGEGEGEYAWHT